MQKSFIDSFIWSKMAETRGIFWWLIQFFLVHFRALLCKFRVHFRALLCFRVHFKRGTPLNLFKEFFCITQIVPKTITKSHYKTIFRLPTQKNAWVPTIFTLNAAKLWMSFWNFAQKVSWTVSWTFGL